MTDDRGPTNDQAREWLAQSDVTKGALGRLAELTEALGMPRTTLTQDIVASIAVLIRLQNELGTLLKVQLAK